MSHIPASNLNQVMRDTPPTDPISHSHSPKTLAPKLVLFNYPAYMQHPETKSMEGFTDVA